MHVGRGRVALAAKDVTRLDPTGHWLDLSRQHTLGGSIAFAGIGVHSGALCRLTLSPAEPGAGLLLQLGELRTLSTARALLARVIGTDHATVIDVNGEHVSTIEHVLAALAALQVDNAILAIEGPEAPILDGSAVDFVDGVRKVGLVSQNAERIYAQIAAPVEVRLGAKLARFEPAAGFELDCEIDFASPAIGRQHWAGAIGPSSFHREFSWARTFVQAGDIAALRARGLARGGGLDNAIVFDDSGPLNPGGLRAVDECVRHKALDAIGDLALLGAPMIGRYIARRPGHSLNIAALRALVEAPGALRWVNADGAARPAPILDASDRAFVLAAAE